MTRPHVRRGGFTLLEILLALSVLSIILLLLLSAFTGAARVRETLSSRSREFRQIRLVLDRVGTDLMGAFATSAREESALSVREDQLSGMPAATLVFTAFQLPDGDGGHPPAEIVKIRYFPRIGADGVTLELHREQSDLPFVGNKIPLQGIRGGGRAAGLPRRAVQRDERGSRSGPRAGARRRRCRSGPPSRWWTSAGRRTAARSRSPWPARRRT